MATGKNWKKSRAAFEAQLHRQSSAVLPINEIHQDYNQTRQHQVIEVGENVKFEKGEEKRERKKPGKPKEKIETTIHSPTYHAHTITPSQSIV